MMAGDDVVFRIYFDDGAIKLTSGGEGVCAVLRAVKASICLFSWILLRPTRRNSSC